MNRNWIVGLKIYSSADGPLENPWELYPQLSSVVFDNIAGTKEPHPFDSGSSRKKKEKEPIENSIE